MKKFLPLLLLAVLAGGCRPKVLVEKAVQLGNTGGTNDVSLVTFEAKEGDDLEISVQCDATINLTVTDSKGQFYVNDVRLAAGSSSHRVKVAHDGTVLVKLRNWNLFKDKTAFVRAERK